MKKYTNMDEYFADFSPEIVERLASIRNSAHEISPDFEEAISYNMPAFKYKKRVLIYFAAYKKHIGFYALPSGNAVFAERLSGYKTSKGTVQFPYDKVLPLDIIGEMMRYRMKEIDEKAKK